MTYSCITVCHTTTMKTIAKKPCNPQGNPNQLLDRGTPTKGPATLSDLRLVKVWQDTRPGEHTKSNGKWP